MLPTLCILLPCYNESPTIVQSLDELFIFIERLIQQQMIAPTSFIAIVDDGSTDDTWQKIKLYQPCGSASLKAIQLSRNQGHQTALLAGMFHFRASYDCIVTLDADLQDDYRAIVEMLTCYKEKNAEIVYGVRKKRNSDTFFKRYTALLFYKLMRWLGVEIVENHADFRLTSSKVVRHLESFREVNLFLRGIYPLLGFQSDYVYYERFPRQYGKSKYSLSKMISFALEGITSLSIKPLRVVTWLGFVIFLISILLSLYAMKSYWENRVVPGWTSTVLPMYLLGGIQLLGIGIIGEYIGKIYQEVKQRPRYFIQDEI